MSFLDELIHVRTELGQPLTVEGVPLDQVLFENLGGPLSELNTALGFDAVAHRDIHVQVVKFTLRRTCRPTSV